MPAVTLPLAALAAGAAGGLGWSLVEAQAFVLRRATVPVLPAGAPDVRVLHLSDLHLTPRQHRKAAWVRRLARLEPDLVISTGDSLAHPEAVPTALDAHGELLERPGAFVLGSNDYRGPVRKNPARYLLPIRGPQRPAGEQLPTADLVRGFRAAGWLDLTNRRDRLTVRGLEFAFVGVDDPHLGLDRMPPPDPDGVAGADVAIGVAHAPYRRVLDGMVADGAGLLIAGHTHGGQLCLPGIGALVTNCDLPRRQAKGVSRWGGSWLHVSAGLGTSPYTPVRFACRPEATLLTLRAADRATG